MCKLVSELLGADKQIVREMFTRLEKRSGEPGVDLRLTGEVYGKLHMKMRALGLDPQDTTPHELYQALLNLTALHDGFIAKRMGIENADDPDEISLAIVTLLKRLHIPKHAWVLKQTTAKRMLKAMPPKTVMKLLNYRSLDSMLKREPAALLLTIARHIEPLSWQERFVHGYKKLHAYDFEVRSIEIDLMQGKKWARISQLLNDTHRRNTIYTPEVGVIALLPLPSLNTRGLTLATLLVSLHHVNEIRAFSTYCKFHHMNSNFGTLLVEHLLHNKRDHVHLAGQPVHWRIVHRYYGSSSRLHHPELFEPHLQPEDLAYRKAEFVLYHLEPALNFWHDIDYVGLPKEDSPISFNLTDMAMNLVNGLPYERRVYYHMQDALWNEICARYIGQRAFENIILQQLDEHTAGAISPLPDMEFVW